MSAPFPPRARSRPAGRQALTLVILMTGLLVMPSWLLTLGPGTVDARTIKCPTASVCTGTNQNDTIKGQGVNEISGKGGNDTLTSNGASNVSGGNGNDRITATVGDNNLSGGAGNDVIKAANGKPDTIDCGSGDDTATYDRKLDVVTNCERKNPK